MSLFTFFLSFLCVLKYVHAGLPNKVYGVNLGSWLLIEPWMLPAEWVSMGGQMCDDCSKCIGSEFAFAQAYPDTVDAKFARHWDTWFNQTDVDNIVENGLNTVRIPLGYWIVEALVDRETEFYPRGGIKALRRGLSQLKKAGVNVILDHHALPGVHTPNQMFAGRCTNDVQFYTDYNFHRALVWTAVMTALSHLDPVFSTVFSIHAINEPIMDASKTPGYGEFSKNFVKTIRAVESLLGIHVEHNISIRAASSNFTAVMDDAARSSNFSAPIAKVLKDTVPILISLAVELELQTSIFNFQPLSREPLVTNFMDINWQYNNPSNPADAAIGPQTYDNHLYYSFGGVAEPTEEAHLTHICNLERVQNNIAEGNFPLWFGEWWLAPWFEATDEFIRKFTDAQKLAYTKGKGWIFWSFKMEKSDLIYHDHPRTRDYFEGVRRGYLTKDPSAVHDPHVCDPYIKS